MAGDILTARRTQFVTAGGRRVTVARGATARAGHPVVQASPPDLWVPLVPTFEVEEPEPAKAAKPAAAKET